MVGTESPADTSSTVLLRSYRWLLTFVPCSQQTRVTSSTGSSQRVQASVMASTS